MQIATKAQIARATLTALTAIASLFFLGILVFVLCAGLQINPFRERTTSFLLAAFAGLIGVAAILVLLNVAANFSLIADAKLAELKVDSHPRLLTKWLMGLTGIGIVVVAVIFAGTYLSRERHLAVVRGQADEVLQENKDLLDEIGSSLASGKVADYRRVHEIRTYLANQRSGLPNLTLIYSGDFKGKRAFYEVQGYFPGDADKGTYDPSYFRCTANLDCDYLKRFFAGGRPEVLREYTYRDDEFSIYIPHAGIGNRFVLAFTRRNSYGKIGS